MPTKFFVTERKLCKIWLIKNNGHFFGIIEICRVSGPVEGLSGRLLRKHSYIKVLSLDEMRSYKIN